MAFTHLHVHSEYSLLDGACRIRDLIARAKELGQTSIAITDHGVMYGAVVFYQQAVKAGIKPIIGCEVYMAARTRFDKDFELDSARHHLILLCKNDTGYKNLCHMVSASFTEGFYNKPRIDMDLLREHSEGLIALSACVYGEIPKLITDGRYLDAKAKALEMAQLFGSEDGKSNFYLELQNHGFADQPKVNEGLIKIHNETGIPLVITNDVHYMTRADAEAQDILMCIQTGKKADDADRMRFESKELYFKSEEEMRKVFSADAPKALKVSANSVSGSSLLSDTLESAFKNTTVIADMCDFAFDFTKHHLPEYTLPEGERSAEEYLKKLCGDGLKNRYGAEPDNKAELDTRLEYELNMIARMGFTDYFLIMNDCIDYARSQGIPVGPGRGSAAGSIVSYCLGLTNIDPIKYGLYFERFLNPERVTMPDIDIDFCERRRSEVLDYVKQKYGTDRVAQIVTFGTLKPKLAVRSVSKVLSLSFQEEGELAREIPDSMPDGSAITLQKALETNPKLLARYNNEENIKRVLDTAMALEDMPYNSGTHASGIVITKLPLKEYLPLTLSKKDNTIATQYTMVPIEELGLLKMDFLGLRNLTIIDDAVREIHKTQPDFSINDIPEDDEPTYQMLSAGKTSGVFQLESQGMTAVCTGLKPKSIEDITAVIALYRPGPMDSIPKFLQWSQNPKLIKYKHPLLEPILKVTYGCIVYQEQVIEIFKQLAGFSTGQADMIRRAMSKKKASEIEREKKAFIEGDAERGICGAVATGVPKDVAASIYEEIEAFANYAFNKSHAVAYAIISYQNAYLKCHFPQIYMAALLSSVLGRADKIAGYTAECKKMGIALLPPDINESDAYFTVSGSNLRYGLAAVKNIGKGLIEKVKTERELNGLYKSFEDFCRRMYGGELNRRALESMIKCGCFDGLGANRRQLMMICQSVIDDVTDYKRRNVDGQLDMFSMVQDNKASEGSGGSTQTIELPDLPEYSKSDLSRLEREVTGLYLSGHPMDDYRDIAERAGAVNIGDILEAFTEDEDIAINTVRKFKDNQKTVIAGIIEEVTTKPTKNNSLMAFLKLDDGSGTIEILVFQKVIDAAGEILREQELVLVSGRISERTDKPPQILADTVVLLRNAQPAATDSRPAATGGHPAGGSRPVQQNTSMPTSSVNDATAGKVSSPAGKTLYVRLDSEDSPKYQYLKLVHMMFPGRDKMVVYFKDTQKKVGSTCVIHEAFLKDLYDKFDKQDVVVK